MPIDDATAATAAASLLCNKVLESARTAEQGYPRSQLRCISGMEIKREQINYMLNKVYGTQSNAISARLQFEVETFIQLFVDLLVGFVERNCIHGALNSKNTLDFFAGDMRPMREIYGHYKCITQMHYTCTMHRTIQKSFRETLRERRGVADVHFDDTFTLRFYTIISEALSYACGPMLVQYDADSGLSANEWNKQLRACFDEFRDEVVEAYRLVQLPPWYVDSMSPLS